MDFNSTILIDNEIVLFTAFINQNIDDNTLFDADILIRTQSFKKEKTTLKDTVKWLNTIFSQTYCSSCKFFNKTEKDSGLCFLCYKSKCFRVNTNKVCSICLDDIHHNIYKTKCSHFFHNKCIFGLEKCPNCRFSFVDELDWYEDREGEDLTE